MPLGKGLSSLIPQKSNNPNQTSALPSTGGEADNTNTILQISIEKIVPNPEQPRQVFEIEALQELSDSIKDKGILQPLVATELGNGNYELIAGERRLQASKLAGLRTVPVIVRQAKNEMEKLELALIENIQRRDLNPMEKAVSYKRLQEEFHLTQEEVAKKLGKTRPSIANTLRLLELPKEIQNAIQEERISEGHARSILGIKDPEKQRLLFSAILQDKLSVRDTEEAVKKVRVRLHDRTVTTTDPDIKNLENRLVELLGTKVSLTKKGKQGKIIIEFYSEEELRNIVNKIC